MKKILSIFAVLFSFLALSAATFIILNKQYVIDQVNVWQYKPNSRAEELIDRTGFNDHGRFLFYASRPSIEDPEHFNQECQKKEAGSSVLGCYSGKRVYVYNVKDERLDGVKVVTAVHETLHAAYDRLSEKEKNEVNKMVEKEFKRHSDDAELQARMGYYKRNQPGTRDNELHSILGSEYPNLIPELEEYYKRYFKDRNMVVKEHEKYSGRINNIKNQYEDSRKRLEDMSRRINAESKVYKDKVSQLNADVDNFNERALGGKFSSQNEFNARRDSLIYRSDQIENMRQRLQDESKEYEQERQKYNSLVDESNQMMQALDSTKNLAPSPSL